MRPPFPGGATDQQDAQPHQREPQPLSRAQAFVQEQEAEQEHQRTVEIADHAHPTGAQFVERAEVQGVGQRDADHAAGHDDGQFLRRQRRPGPRMQHQRHRCQHGKHQSVLEQVERERRQMHAQLPCQDHAHRPCRRAAQRHGLADAHLYPSLVAGA